MLTSNVGRNFCSLFVITFTLLSATLGQSQEAATGDWHNVQLPFRALNTTGQRGSLWVCGVDEGIASSSDNGMTWKTRHQSINGGVLLDIDFVDDKFGYAAGTGGLLLTTEDGGDTWATHTSGPDTVLQISFSDAQHGLIRTTAALQYTVDGGAHWSSVNSAENAEDWKAFRYPFALVALDASHFAVMLKQGSAQYEPQALLVTDDSGKSWKLVNLPNVTLYSFLRVQGRYWTVGTEVIHKDQPGGGYGVPVALSSIDGQKWEHATNDISACKLEMCTVCRTQGCFSSSSGIARIFGAKTTYATFPPTKALTWKWVSNESTICFVGSEFQCAALRESANPPEPTGAGPVKLAPGPLTPSTAQGPSCLACGFDRIFIDKKAQGNFTIKLHLAIARNGTVKSVEVEGAPTEDVRSHIQKQAEQWLFEPFLKDGVRADAVLNMSVQVALVKPH